MTAINHSLTGILIATVVDRPAIALPLAFLSHFFLDILPHFGEPDSSRTVLSWIMWGVDAIVTGSLGLFLFGETIEGRLSPIYLAAMFLAILPDLFWFKKRVINEWYLGLPVKPKSAFGKFHSKIQKLQFPHGWLYEIIWFFGMIFLLNGRLY